MIMCWNRTHLGGIWGVAVVLAMLPSTARTASSEDEARAWKVPADQLRPFWESTKMSAESCLFIQYSDGKLPCASLLFEPTEVLSVTDSTGRISFVEGKDFTWKAGSREIVLPIGSGIIHKSPQDLRRPTGSQPHRLTHRDGNGEILFGATHQYHDMQTLVTYEHEPNAWPESVPTIAKAQLGRALSKLKNREQVDIAVLGDSISTGCNASGWANVAPYQPAYYDLLALRLTRHFGSQVDVKNFSVGGTDTAWGCTKIKQVMETDPDLLILAFGMNDAAGRTSEAYRDNTLRMIDAARQTKPDVEIILIASMLGNRDWTVLQHDRFDDYRNALVSLCGPGIALADMTSIWDEFLRRKKDWDITGNGVNHPNDFGHRVYAQVLSALLISK